MRIAPIYVLVTRIRAKLSDTKHQDRRVVPQWCSCIPFCVISVQGYSDNDLGRAESLATSKQHEVVIEDLIAATGFLSWHSILSSKGQRILTPYPNCRALSIGLGHLENS